MKNVLLIGALALALLPTAASAPSREQSYSFQCIADGAAPIRGRQVCNIDTTSGESFRLDRACQSSVNYGFSSDPKPDIPLSAGAITGMVCVIDNSLDYPEFFDRDGLFHAARVFSRLAVHSTHHGLLDVRDATRLFHRLPIGQTRSIITIADE